MPCLIVLQVVKERGEYCVQMIKFTIHGLQQMFLETWHGSE